MHLRRSHLPQWMCCNTTVPGRRKGWALTNMYNPFTLFTCQSLLRGMYFMSVINVFTNCFIINSSLTGNHITSPCFFIKATVYYNLLDYCYITLAMNNSVFPSCFDCKFNSYREFLSSLLMISINDV